MRAMLLEAPRTPLRAAEIREPRPDAGELLLRVRACAVCRTDLHIVDGELTRPKLPLVPGHMIVADVVGGNGGDGLVLGRGHARSLGFAHAGDAPGRTADAVARGGDSGTGPACG